MPISGSLALTFDWRSAMADEALVKKHSAGGGKRRLQKKQFTAMRQGAQRLLIIRYPRHLPLRGE
jgi:hypothetical protein